MSEARQTVAKAAPKAGPKAKQPLDAFGYRINSLKSKAAAMYSSKKGATLAEVKDATGSIQLNVVTELKNKGKQVTKKKEKGPGQREITRYFIK